MANEEKTKEQLIQEHAEAWYVANADKNAANNIETRERKFLEKAVGNEKFEVVISDTMKLKIGYQQIQVEEVDAKKLMEKNPNLFWSLVSVPKTALEEILGPKDAAQYMRVVDKNAFKIEKDKTKK